MDWQDVKEIAFQATDVAFEDELARNPYSIRVWWSYIQSKQGAPAAVRYLLFERAVKALPGVYKFWNTYLILRREECQELSADDPEVEAANAVHERALVFMSKMPRIWLDYCSFLIGQEKVTLTRRTFDRALRALPITLHTRVWVSYTEFIQKPWVPQETALVVFRRYLMLEPDEVEIYIQYLMAIEKYDEAAVRLADVVNDEDFASKQGKTHHQLWMDLCDLISKHPEHITSLRPEPILRSGLRKFTDEVGRLWNALADHFIRLNQFEKARDVCEEGMMAVTTVRDFSLVFDAYAKFTESFVSALMERDDSNDPEMQTRIDLWLARMEDVAARRPLLLSSVLLRQNPHDVNEWLARTELFGDDHEKIIKCFAEGVMTVDPPKAVGRLSSLWIAFAKFYEGHNDLANAREIFEKAVLIPLKSVDEVASVWCEWAEMEIRHGQLEQAVEVARRSIDPPRDAAKGSVQARTARSVKLQCLHCDLEESFGTISTVMAGYDRAVEQKVVTPQMMLNYASYLEAEKYWEKSFKVYEKAVALYRWPQVRDLWLQYLSKFVERFGGRKLERARELFEQALEDCPEKYVRRILMLYAKLEEEHGLARRALDIYKRSCSLCPAEDRFDMYNVYIAKTAEFFGLARTREIYTEAIEKLPDDKVMHMCLLFAKKEKTLGEIDRARAIYLHASQFAPPHKEESFWNTWKNFEVQHGNEDTFREMLRVKRSVEAQYTQVHFNTADIVNEANEAGADVDDPMAVAEKEVVEDRKRRTSGDGPGGKKMRVGTTPVEKKELLTEFHASKTYTGSRIGFVFKLGAQGQGYYKEMSDKAADAAEKLATVNPEELELELDLSDDDDDDAVQVPKEKPVPAAVFGSGSTGESHLAKEGGPSGTLSRFAKKK